MKVVDRLSQALITAGGIGTIAAVGLVCIFLVVVVLPLFEGAELREAVAVHATPTAAPLHLEVDEYQTMALSLDAKGVLRVFDMAKGQLLDEHRLGDEATPLTAASLSTRTGDAVFGYADGSVRLGTVRFNASFLTDGEVPEAVRQLEPGASMPLDKGVVTRTAQRQLRLQQVEVALEEPVKAESPAAVLLIDGVTVGSGPVYASLSADGVLRLRRIRKRRNMLTGKTTVDAFGGELPFTFDANDPPKYLKVSGLGDNVLVIWEDGRLIRYDTRDMAQPRLAESLDLTPEGATLTSATFLIGRTTLLTGDSAGRVRAWFRIKPDDADTPDGALLVAAHELPGATAAVTSLTASTRSRMVGAGYADGSVRLFHVTTGTLIGTFDPLGTGAVHALAMAPKDDGVLALTAEGMGWWRFDARYPAATWRAMVQPVWYEGYNEPAHVWQSSGGTDDFEPKYGMWPLVFGTLKATLYSMLFGLPIALVAAIYTSEFLSRRARARIKPTIEMMASLPSVVLGFLAGLVIAPMVERVLSQVLAALVVVPFMFALAAHVWQLLPQHVTMRLASYRLLLIALVLPVGVALSAAVGPMIETIMFAGDLHAWLDGRTGSGVAGWAVLCLPMSVVLVGLAVGRWVNTAMRQRFGESSRSTVALVSLLKFLGATAGVLVVAGLLGWFANTVIGDPRGSMIDTYVQKNALVVGFVMGFAIIPIIYTIADDAMSAVPEHLRAGSLGAGATPWQTATRIIIPTAMSGLFSAVMIGLGRAVGETMIVLMAAGNTPVMQWNMFNGFRTLSANIAVELPEAPIGGTHYRMLFLAALCLFAMTFIVNTIAEMVRLRFRKRAYQL